MPPRVKPDPDGVAAANEARNATLLRPARITYYVYARLPWKPLAVIAPFTMAAMVTQRGKVCVGGYALACDQSIPIGGMGEDAAVAAILDHLRTLPTPKAFAGTCIGDEFVYGVAY